MTNAPVNALGMLPRLALVQVWSGPWSPWINLYIETCRYNPEVDFLIFSDQPPPANRSGNVRFLPLTRAGLAARIRSHLKLKPWLDRAYKLCDYKPFFGLLFEKELAAYTHWGYCDEDMFWGRLRRFITADLLAENDIVTSTRCCIAGQLTIFRNTERVNRLPLRVTGWRELLLTKHTTNLAETLINAQALSEEETGVLTVSRRQIQVHDEHDADWNDWANKLERAATGRTLGLLPYGPATWHHGEVRQTPSGPEFAFFHFKVWKKTWNLSLLPPPPRGIIGWECTARGLRFQRARGWPTAPVALFLLRHRLGVVRARVRRKVRETIWQWRVRRADAARARRLAAAGH